jgi:transcriptional antiterminator RfaH
MPILGAEPCSFPDELLAEASPWAPDEDSERRWWVVYTKSRQEKALARQLYGQQLSFYLPLVPQDHLIRGRRVRALVPLFQGYVFLFGTPDERVQSLTTNRISRILPVSRQDELGRELTQLRMLIALGIPLTAERRLAPGQQVRIRTGPLAGFEGTVTQRRGGERLLIAVTYLQQGVSIEINDFMVEAISPTHAQAGY